MRHWQILCWYYFPSTMDANEGQIIDSHILVYYIVRARYLYLHVTTWVWICQLLSVFVSLFQIHISQSSTFRDQPGTYAPARKSVLAFLMNFSSHFRFYKWWEHQAPEHQPCPGLLQSVVHFFLLTSPRHWEWTGKKQGQDMDMSTPQTEAVDNLHIKVFPKTLFNYVLKKRYPIDNQNFN
jgi:hypothetical protein